jgi:hypothetical protein
MEPAQAEEHPRISAIMEFTNKELLRRGSMKFLGAMLWTCLDYPDRPFGWDHDPEVKKAFTRALAEAVASGDTEAQTRLRPELSLKVRELRPNRPSTSRTMGVGSGRKF